MLGADTFACCVCDATAVLGVGTHGLDALLPLLGGAGDQQIFSAGCSDPCRCGGSCDDRHPHCHRFQDLVLDSACDLQRHNNDIGVVDGRADVGDLADDLNPRTITQLLDRWPGMLADDRQRRLRILLDEFFPDVVGEPRDAFDVGLVIQHTDKNESWIGERNTRSLLTVCVQVGLSLLGERCEVIDIDSVGDPVDRIVLGINRLPQHIGFSFAD